MGRLVLSASSSVAPKSDCNRDDGVVRFSFSAVVAAELFEAVILHPFRTLDATSNSDGNK